ncbi:photosystem II reaction center PsbP [Capilliphycus salinus ALCB114379]|uniref:photosystem II reaction center PsbP n=1 Tax=Capilliphycus salinus TaxID=2768948 RepID=UPI0039A6B02D
MLKRITAILFVIVSLTLGGCVSIGAAGLNSFVDTTDGYEFLYPNGWVEVKVSDGPDVVFHDMIEQTENVSVVISPIPDHKTLDEIGTPTEVGYKLSKNAIAPPGSGREAELVNAESRQKGDKTYYLLEYAVTLPNQKRHDFASVTVSRDQLFTLNISTPEKRWEKTHNQLEQVVKSFNVY